jgi:hypothetical protein
MLKELVVVVKEPKELGRVDEVGWIDPEIVASISASSDPSYSVPLSLSL